MELVRKPLYPDTTRSCNNRNIYEYTPYIIIKDEKLTTYVIDEAWWHSLPPYCQQLIIQRTNNQFIIKPITIPHEFQFDDTSKFLSTIYKCYNDAFDYNI